jgi:hypothetical protein
MIIIFYIMLLLNLYIMGCVLYAQGYEMKWSGGLFKPIPVDWTPGSWKNDSK